MAVVQSSSAFRWKDGQVWLAKCTEALPIRWSRPLPEGCEPSTITVKLDPVALARFAFVDNPNIQHLPTCKVGWFGCGLSSLLVTDDGKKLPIPDTLSLCAKKLRQVQKALDRKQKGSTGAKQGERWLKFTARLLIAVNFSP